MAELPIYAVGGESLCAPEDTLVGYWAALGTGADGLALTVRLSSNGTVVCARNDSLMATCGARRRVSKTSDKQLRSLDAGKTFRSSRIDRNGRPTGVRGDDRPWVEANKRPALYHPTLEEVLRLFSRRTGLILTFPTDCRSPTLKRLVDKALTLLATFGMPERCVLVCGLEACGYVRSKTARAKVYLADKGLVSPRAGISAVEDLRIAGLALDPGRISRQVGSRVRLDDEFVSAWVKARRMGILFTSPQMPQTLARSCLSAITELPRVTGVLADRVEYTHELLMPAALVLQDRFVGSRIDRSIWSAGYSHANRETTIRQKNGLIIDIQEGESYSGAAAVTVIPVHGRFDAQVAFTVSNPHQGTTFEMAAIGIDPGYFRTDNRGLNSRSVNLTFDVHGAAPYASSERDEDDGFRAGWNNGFNLTRVADDWKASSVNMYNKYTRDVGYGGPDSKKGHLRLVRNGSVYNTYYKDQFNPAWVCSGSVLVPNLAEDVFIRLAAKHWNKVDPAPANKVVFKDFRIYQW